MTDRDAEREHGTSPKIDFGSVFTDEAFGLPGDGAADPAEEALTKRRSFSIRSRMILTIGVLFLFPLTITIWTISVFHQLNDKILFIEAADDLKMEIQQARRFEKNFLLYGTNLEDAREHALNAQAKCKIYRDRFRPVVGDAAIETMQRNLAGYLGLLDALTRGRNPAAEESLRVHGGRLGELAQDFVEKERNDVHRIVAQFQRMPFLFLLALFLIIVAVLTFLARYIMRTLHRFTGYMERISGGDLTPITPARKYRDEFSTLAVYVNRMVRNLDRQHRILVESHKLRAMGNLVSGVAHELNNPMNNILLTASVLDEDYDTLEPEEVREMIVDLVNEAERTKRIVANLLDYARQSETKVEPLDLRNMLEECVQLVGNQIRLKKVRLRIDVPEDLPAVHGDRQLLAQVFVNLLLNALDALPEGGEIRVGFGARRREGFLAVDVSDNGPGMPDHVLDRIFEPFFTTKPRSQGTGLGLSVSQGIVKKHGGYILVKSEVGAGTTFSVLLPTTDIPSDLAARLGPVSEGDRDREASDG